jgi:hypothetical protein
MSGLDNRSILAKADLALADILGSNGILQPAQAQEFVRLLIKQSKILGMSTVTPLKAPKQIVNKIRFANRVLRRGYEGQALPDADRTKPNFSNVEHDAQLFKAEVRITNETLEDNIEGERLRDTIMSLLAEAVSRDMEEVIVNGDTASSDPFLAAFDGVLKRATSNLVNGGNVALSKTVLRDMLKTLPSEYLRNKASMRFLTSVDAEIDYRDSLSDRATNLGDTALAAMGESTAPVGYSGIPVVDVPLFPENLGGSSNQTNVILTDPKNIDVGIWRQIRIETDKDISEGVLKIVATIRFDALYQEETAVVKATAVKVSA